jgi:hypothetical protein
MLCDTWAFSLHEMVLSYCLKQMCIEIGERDQLVTIKEIDVFLSCDLHNNVYVILFCLLIMKSLISVGCFEIFKMLLLCY